MRKSILTSGLVASSLLLAAFAAPAFAESHEGPLVFEGDCVAVIEKIDMVLETGQLDETTMLEINDETREQVVALRDQGAREQEMGDQAACTATLTLAIQMLNPVVQG